MYGRPQLWLPIVGTILFHVLFGAGLWASGKLERKKEKEKPLVIDFEVAPVDVKPEPKPKPLPKAKVAVAPKPPPPKVAETKPVPPPPQPRPQPRRRVRRTQPPKNAPPPPPNTDPITDPNDNPAPGVGSDDQPYTGSLGPTPEGTFSIPSKGRPGLRSGKGTGGGGSGSGSGPPGPPPPPKPVSIASIKKRPMPIGNTDFISEKNYPLVAKQRRIQGQVKVKLVIDAKGRVVKRTLVKRLGFGLDKLALKFAKRLRFTPAINTNDRAVAATVVWTFTFTLPK